jgi:hypothetical protein
VELLRDYKKEIVCDLAETYHIYNYRDFKPSYIYVLVEGLKSDSRFKMALKNQKVDDLTLLNAKAVDLLSLLVWSKTPDAQAGRNRPKSLVDILLNDSEAEKEGFDSEEEFMKEREKFLRKEGD